MNLFHLIIFVVTILIAFVCGFMLTPHIYQIAHKLNLFDIPDERKVHKVLIPRLGGVAFLPTILVTVSFIIILLLRLNYRNAWLWKLSTVEHFLAYLSGITLLYLVGIYDDLYGASYRLKFAIQIIAASFLCFSGLWIATGSNFLGIDFIPFWLGMPLTILFVIYVTNAINLIDGIDGLASGFSIISLLCVSVINYTSHNLFLVIFSLTWIGVLLAFIYYNMFNKKCKVFMGDAGSLTVGYTLSFLFLHFWQREPVYNEYFDKCNLIVLSTLIIPLFDVIRVFLSRIRDGRNPFLPDRNHIHHKLLRTGMTPLVTMLVLLFVASGFIELNYWMAKYLNETMMIFSDVVVYIGLQYLLNYFIRRKEKAESIEWDRAL